jgi:hypothetical protein
MVHRVKVVEIETAVGEPGRIFPVYEIIVCAHGHGLEATGLELDGKTLAEGGFTG